jgi:hypothetical protein
MQTSKLRLNVDTRKKIANLIQNHFENEMTPELENFKSAKEDCIVAHDRAFKVATKVIHKTYPQDDVKILQAFKNKYGSACDVVAKDSCFYFANTEIKKNENQNSDEYSKHFDFKLNGDLSGRDYDGIDFALAYFRDDLKNAGLNPEINIINKDKSTNPHYSQEIEKCKNFLGWKDETGIFAEWKNKYALDVIGTSYCRSRTIACNNNEYEQMNVFLESKTNLAHTHFAWFSNIKKDMIDITSALREYKYMNDAIELAKKLNVQVNENQLRENVGVSLTIYQPENLANLILSRRVKQDNKAIIAKFKKARQASVAVN